jgi:hypothetical protein
MEKIAAEMLTSNLIRHPYITVEDPDRIFNFLISAEAPKAKKFYQELPENVFITPGSGEDYFLSLGTILRNRNAKPNETNRWKYFYENLINNLRIKNIEVLVRKIEQDKGIIAIMRKCGLDFSLLGCFKTYQHSTESKPERTNIRPILIIPGISGNKDKDNIFEWEQANTDYEKISGILRFPKRISKEEYLSY